MVAMHFIEGMLVMGELVDNFTSDGRFIVSASKDATIRIWELDQQRLRRVITGHLDWVTRIALIADGSMLVSASRDRTVRAWSWESGREMFIYPAVFPVYALSEIRADGRFVAGSSDGQLHFLKLPVQRK